jgi:hypothetical protein
MSFKTEKHLIDTATQFYRLSAIQRAELEEEIAEYKNTLKDVSLVREVLNADVSFIGCYKDGDRIDYIDVAIKNFRESDEDDQWIMDSYTVARSTKNAYDQYKGN